jgi:putative salt-induced outer membrane protein YdiY
LHTCDYCHYNCLSEFAAGAIHLESFIAYNSRLCRPGGETCLKVRACQLVIVCLFCWFSTPWAQATDWQPPVPTDDAYDWVQLSSGEWLKGEIIVLYHGKLEFDSQELDLQTLDFEDIEQIRSAQVVQVRLEGGIDLLGKLYMAEGRIGILGTEQSYERSRLLTIAGGEPREINFWNAKVSLGANWQSGNTEQAEGNLQAKLQRRTLETRLVFDYLGNFNTIDDVVSANNHRGSGVADRFITHRFYTRPVFAEYFRDPFQNIDDRITLGTGVGYQLMETVKTDWSVSGGPAYQYTRFDEVEEGETSAESTPALVGGTDLEIEITGNLDFNYIYQAQFVKPDSGLYNHHMVVGFVVELTRLLDFDVSLVWDRVQRPRADADGIVPEQDDWRLIVGLGFDF